MKKSFQYILSRKGKTVIVGVGNIMRGDDGFGPALIETIKGKVSALCLDAGTAPENYLGKIAKEKPDTVIIVDAVQMELKPGEYEILAKDDIIDSGLTTHNISPKVLIDFLENETDADIYMLGIQPEKISLGDEMSDVVKNAVDNISKLIQEGLKDA